MKKNIVSCEQKRGIALGADGCFWVDSLFFADGIITLKVISLDLINDSMLGHVQIKKVSYAPDPDVFVFQAFRKGQKVDINNNLGRSDSSGKIRIRPKAGSHYYILSRSEQLSMHARLISLQKSND